MNTTKVTPAALPDTGKDFMLTRGSSITRALDEVGDKWCMLIIQEVFWGINTFSGMLEATGVSRGVLSERLKWLQKIGCLRRRPNATGKRSLEYHLTRKSVQLYDCAMMAIVWERKYFQSAALDGLQLLHTPCGHVFSPVIRCNGCQRPVKGQDVSYSPGPGAARDNRIKKVRRRSSLPSSIVPSERNVYRNLVDIVGDRWTANVIALAFHGYTRFDQLHEELPVATNILSDRLKFLRERGVMDAKPYQERPGRYEYYLTEKGWDLYPYFLTLLQWGDRWCDTEGRGQPMRLKHIPCGGPLHGVVCCDQCDAELRPFDVVITLS